MLCSLLLNPTAALIFLKGLFTSNKYNGLFTLPDSDSDSKPDGYIVLCRSFDIGSDPDSNPYSDGFPNSYCIHFRDGSPPQGQISIPILLYFNPGIRV